MGFWRKQQITFFVTSKCNLNCYYCYIPKMKVSVRDQVINIGFARAGLQDFFATNTSRTIRFFSAGEATQAFGRMVEIWDIAHQMAGPALRTELETNGYFSGEVAEWIENNVNILWISCDGPPEIQDAQRPLLDNYPTSGIVLDNVRRYAKCKNIQFGIRATVAKENVERQTELIEYFHSLGVKYVSASPTYHSKVNPDVKTPSLVDFARHFVPAFYRAVELGMFYQTLFMVNFDEEVDIYCQTSIPTPRLTTDGYVSSCDWASFGSKKYLDNVLQELIYGYYDRRKRKIFYDQEKIQRIRQRNVSYLGQTTCKGCSALRHCAGGCVGKMMSETNNLYEASKDWCGAVRYLFEKLPVKKGPFPYLHP